MNNSLTLILDNTGVLVYVIDVETFEILFANQRCKEEFGEITGCTCYHVLQDKQTEPCEFCPIRDKNSSQKIEVGVTYQWENQNSINNRFYLYNDRIIQWTDGRIVKVQVGIDITNEKELQTQLSSKNQEILETFQALSNATIEGLIIYDQEKLCIYANEQVCSLFDYTHEEMIGRTALSFVAPQSKELVSTVIKNTTQLPYESWMIRKDGSLFPAILRGQDMLLSGKQIRVSAILDISDLRKKEDEILHQALYDTLTQLPNRRYLTNTLQHLLQESKRKQISAALLFFDLDHFKNVNDTKGHTIGDKVLIETAQRISKTIRSTDLVARIGGDEFVILLDDINEFTTNILQIAENILDVIRQPYYIGNYTFMLSASIGAILFKGDQYSIETLLQYADSAMYHAKETGRNTIKFFNPLLQKKLEKKASILHKLHLALEQNQMELYYQKQIFGEHKEIVGVEALIRWNDPEQGLISPNEFIPLAEESNCIIVLGEWILREAFSKLKLWENDIERSQWQLSINISIKQFERNNFIQIVQTLLHEIGCDATKIRFELTENLLIKGTKDTLRKIYALKKLGISLSIDDFGTGYSSLSYLSRLPVDELKIDKRFIKRLLHHQSDKTIVETIITIGKHFGMDVVAEGVETEIQYKMLLDLGCSHFQGYLFAKPIPYKEL